MTDEDQTSHPAPGKVVVYTPIRDEIELELPRALWPDFMERYAWPR